MQIVLSLDYGGLEKLAIDLANRFNNGKYRSFICCLDNIGDLAIQAGRRGIKVICAGRKPGIDFSLPFRLSGILKKERVDIVHTHNPGALIYGTLGAKLAGIPVIINTRHGREKRPVNGFIWNMNDSIIAISEDAKKRLLKYNRINSDKVRVVYNGIEVNGFKNELDIEVRKNLLGVDKSHLVIGTVSRLSEEKDQISLIDAFSKVSQVLNNTKLIFVGDGILKKEIEHYSEKVGIGDKVIFLGFREDIAKIISTFDLFTLSSLTEGISLSLLEAMAAGKPIVATNVGGNPEVVIDGETGFLVPPKQPDKMAEAIIKVLQNPELARKMGVAGRERIEKNFSLDRMVSDYSLLYEDLLYKKGFALTPGNNKIKTRVLCNSKRTVNET